MKTDLIYAIHNHQPVGNFDHVLEDAFERCYKPQIDILSEYSSVKASYHHSGSLFEWIEKHRPGYIDKLAELAESGQLEILSGGFYEPILSSVPFDDAVEQIDKMNQYILNRFGVVAEGIWLAERIWDPAIPAITKAAGIKFTILDDTHFKMAGLTRDIESGYYIAEKDDAAVLLFPIDMKLRYSIPFKSADENIEYFSSRSSSENSVLTYGDDGEKFGLWPDTYDWVYKKGWLSNFYKTLAENENVVKTISFKEAILKYNPKSKIYIPPASYEEMMEWSLPADLSLEFHDIVDQLKSKNEYDRYRPFLRGGIWSNFKIKYDESSRISKKSLYLSNKLRKHAKKISADKIDNIKENIFKGECNCAYWHGMFGGIYLNNLRDGLYRSLIKAEQLLDKELYPESKARIERLDYDTDLSDDIILSDNLISVVIDPDYGGSLLDFSYKPKHFSLSNSMRRSKEGYHDKLSNLLSNASETEGQPKSIHDRVVLKEENLHSYLVYDKYLRRSFLDYIFDCEIDFDSFINSNYKNLDKVTDGRYKILKTETAKNRVEALIGNSLDFDSGSLLISKMFRLVAGSSNLSVEYLLENRSNKELKFSMITDLSFNLLTDRSEDRYYSKGNLDKDQKPTLGNLVKDRNVKEVGFVDGWSKFELTVKSDQSIDFCRYPIYTVSQSESGFEKVFQGNAVALKRNLNLAVDSKTRFSIDVTIKDL